MDPDQQPDLPAPDGKAPDPLWQQNLALIREGMAFAQKALVPAKPEGLDEAVRAFGADHAEDANKIADSLAALAGIVHGPVDDHGRRLLSEEGLERDRRAVQGAAIRVAELGRLLLDGPLRDAVQALVSEAFSYANSLRLPEYAPPRADWFVLLGGGLFGRCNWLVDRLRQTASVGESTKSEDSTKLGDDLPRLRRVLNALEDLREALLAHTIEDAIGRRVHSIPGSVALSEAFKECCAEIMAVVAGVLASRVAVERSTEDVVFYKPIKFGRDINASLAAVVFDAQLVVTWPSDRWNEENDKNPGNPGNRYHFDDRIPREDLSRLDATIRAAERVLLKNAPTPGESSGEAEPVDKGGVIAINIENLERCTRITRKVNGAVVDQAEIRGPALTRLFRIVTASQPNYLSWTEVEARWPLETGWKGKLLGVETLKDYGRRIQRTLSDAGLGKYWRYSSDEVAWTPPPS